MSHLASGGSWHSWYSLVYSCITPILVSMVLFPMLLSVSLYQNFPLISLIKILVIGLRVHLNPIQPHLNWITSTKFLFSIEVIFSGDSDSKESACNTGRYPELGRYPGEGNSYPLQYSCLDNFMDRGAQ